MPAELPIEISCQEVAALQRDDEEFLFLDCREQDEYDLVRIEGTRLVPMTEFVARAGELSPHAGQRVVVHCHHGGRSLQAANWLRRNGFPQAQSMAGGIDQWAAEIQPGMARY